jgi:hypothetical protein
MSNEQQENTKIAASNGGRYLRAIARYKVARLDWLLTDVLCVREYFSGVQITGDLPLKFLQRPPHCDIAPSLGTLLAAYCCNRGGLYCQLPLVPAFGGNYP